jgi:hypothetical protein
VGPHDSLCAEIRKLVLGKGSFFAECLPARHSTKVAPVAPLLVPLTSALGEALEKECFFAECQDHNYRQKKLYQFQVWLLLQVLWSWHSAKSLFVESYTWQSDQKNLFFISFYYSKQTKHISHNHHIYMSKFTESSHI